MALTKVKGSGVEGITNLSNATFLSVNASEVATLLTSAVINSEGGAVTTNIAQGLTKEWCLFDQRGSVLGANTIGDSFNVGSVTDVSTGIIQMNFTNNMSGTSYSSVANCNYTGEIGQVRYSRFCGPAGLATSSYRQGAQYVNGTSEDVYWTLSTNGDLA